MQLPTSPVDENRDPRTVAVDVFHAVSRSMRGADDVVGLDIDALQACASTQANPVLEFINVRDAFLRGSRAPANTGVYLELHGAQTADIELAGNLMRSAKTPVRRAAEVGRKAVRISH